MTNRCRLVALLVILLSVALLLTPSPADAQQAPVADPVVDVAMAEQSACAVFQSGIIECWGQNDQGQLGNGVRSAPLAVPAPVLGITNATAVATTGRTTCAVLETGRIMCWGEGRYGLVGNGTTTTHVLTPVAVQGINDATAISMAWDSACALLSSGGVKCWGQGAAGLSGSGDRTTLVPVTAQGISNATAVTHYGNGACAVLANGGIKCWGENDYGQLGSGVMADSPIPVAVQGISNATALSSTGVATRCAVLQSGSIKCWGSNYAGQLGDGTTADSLVPLVIPGITNATEVAIGVYGSVCAVLDTGSIKCWGANYWGQLGNGTTIASAIPVTVTGITNATAIEAGSRSYCSILSSGSIQCWGENVWSQLGNGTTTDSSVPVDVAGVTNATAITSTEYATHCAIVASSTIRCWGLNRDGQLGHGVTDSGPVPRPPVTALTQAQSQLVSGSGAADGWAIVSNVRLYVPAACRSQLEAAGRTFVVTPWAAYSAIPDQPAPPCDVIEDIPPMQSAPPPTPTPPTPTPPPPTTTPPTGGEADWVTNSGANTAGWALVDGTRQWLSAACRQQLEAAGASFTITRWTIITDSPKTTTRRTCEQLQTLIGPGPNGGGLFRTNGNANGGFWIEGSQRKWLTNSCMSQLAKAGATITAVPWSQIAPTTDNPRLTTCREIVAGL